MRAITYLPDRAVSQTGWNHLAALRSEVSAVNPAILELEARLIRKICARCRNLTRFQGAICQFNVARPVSISPTDSRRHCIDAIGVIRSNSFKKTKKY